METPDRATLLETLAADRTLAHQVLFEHRHPDATPDFHRDIGEDYASGHPASGIEAFRGGGKSSISEEFVTLEALFERAHNIMLAGATYSLACERLHVVKNEIETNEFIIDLFGDQVGPVWNEGKIVLKNGVCIQAKGAGQSFRGTKHLHWRPDLFIGDDLEDDEAVDTEKQGDDLLTWLLQTVGPALDPHTGRMRIIGTPFPKGLMERLKKLPNWRIKTFPIVLPASTNPEEWDEALWPARFPLNKIRALRDELEAAGKLQVFTQEYLCRAEDPTKKLFLERHIKINPTPPAWAPTWVYCDPARTTKLRTSARTGYAAWSWIGGRRLYVRKAFGAFHKPDEIVSTLFELNERFHPVQIGVEPDGLEEFIFQPLRQAQLDRHTVLPLASGKTIRAPKDKDGFIGALQPFFEAGEIELSGECADLITELLAFPSGRKDVPNALAYALRMRPGRPIYEDFSPAHIADQPFTASARHPAFLAVNATAGLFTALLLQRLDGAIRILADWVFDGPAGDGLDAIVPDAAMVAGRAVTLYAPAERFERWDATGLIAAARRKNITIRHGRSPKSDTLVPWLRRQIKGFPALMASPDARWTINALTGGYTRTLDPSGRVSNQPEENQYKHLIQGLEALVGEFDAASQAESSDASDLNWQYTREGRPYISARPSI